MIPEKAKAVDSNSNMQEAGIHPQVLVNELASRTFRRTLPTEFLAAAKHNPRLENELIGALLRKVALLGLGGSTCVVIDVSGSAVRGRPCS